MIGFCHPDVRACPALVAGKDLGTINISTGCFGCLLGRPPLLMHSRILADLLELQSSNGNPLILISQHTDSLKIFQTTAKTKKYALSLQSLDQRVEIFTNDGLKKTKEFSYGSSYLGQSSRVFYLNEDVDSIVVYDYAGKGRRLSFPEKVLTQK